MVLRKPYAFLIKHFRLIHLIITGLFGLLALENRKIYKYITAVISDSVNRYDAFTYINYGIYFYMLIALLLCFVVFWLLKYKDKPRKIYIFTIAGYLIIGIFMFILFNYMNSFSNTVVDQKTIRFYRDVQLMTLFFQYYIIIVMFIRGLGFDIKRFNFAKDVQELNASAEDAEEIEVDTRIDTTNVVRGIRKQGREFGYFFREFRVYIIVILVVVFGFLMYKGYGYFSKLLKVYHEGDMIGNINHITLKDSYFSVNDDNNVIIVKFDAYKNGVKDRLNTGNFVLAVGKRRYTPDKNICYKFNNLGNCYKKQYITNNSQSYILTYTVDKLNSQNTYLLYTESYDSNYKVKLDMKNYGE